MLGYLAIGFRATYFGRADSEDWLNIAASAHRSSLPSNATMLYGHIENTQEKVYHLTRLRDVQDETGGFWHTYPCLSIQSAPELADLPGPTGCLDLKAGR